MMRIAFMGTPEFAVPTLAELVGSGFEIAAVYTQPARPAGRGRGLRPSPVQAFAEAHGLPVRTPENFKDPVDKQAFADLELDAAVVVAYGLILPKAVLEAPRLGCFNLHASLLPRWRGAAPIQRAIMAGDTETGVMVMQMETGLDTGPVVVGERVEIGPEMTAGALHDVLARVGAGLMPRALAALERGGAAPTPQPEEGVTYAAKIEKSESRIDWTRPAVELDFHIRGLTPFPGAYFPAADDRGLLQRIKVLRAVPVPGKGEPGAVLDDRLTVACGEGALQIQEVQRAGKARANAADFLRGFKLPAGTRLPLMDTDG